MGLRSFFFWEDLDQRRRSPTRETNREVDTREARLFKLYADWKNEPEGMGWSQYRAVKFPEWKGPKK